MPPTGRSLIGWGSYIIEPAPPGDDKVPSPVQGPFNIYQNLTNGGRKPSSKVDTVPHGVETPVPLARIADWFELHSDPHRSRRMIEAHQPMAGSSVAHGGDRAPYPVPLPLLQPQQRGNDNDDLPGRYTSPHGVSTPTPLAYFS